MDERVYLLLREKIIKKFVHFRIIESFRFVYSRIRIRFNIERSYEIPRTLSRVNRNRIHENPIKRSTVELINGSVHIYRIRYNRGIIVVIEEIRV